jgi:hypothetical protein
MCSSVFDYWQASIRPERRWVPRVVFNPCAPPVAPAHGFADEPVAPMHLHQSKSRIVEVGNDVVTSDGLRVPRVRSSEPVPRTALGCEA